MMAPLRLFAVASLLLGPVVAQAGDNSDSLQRVWAAVAFVNHGETTPLLGPLETILTPQGAEQLYRQGVAFRGRYLSINSKDPGPNAAPIRNISQDAIDNKQITALSQSQEWVAAGATAFFQGLYPANNVAYNDKAGGMDIGRNYLADDQEVITYPLDGYQYARIQTFSALDKQYPSLQGTVGCATRNAEIASNLLETEDMQQSYRGSIDFYQKLFESGPLRGLVPPGATDFTNAYDIYELVKYMYTHNTTVWRQLENANDTIATLESIATDLESALTSPPSDSTDEEIDTLYTIAGRTLASKIEAQFMANLARGGQEDKLTIMFGSHTPLMSFFHIASLKSGNKTSDPFSQLPKPGAAMLFELIGEADAEDTEMPSRDDLRVRFLYRASADEDEDFKPAGLFGSSGAEQGIPWSDFSRQMINLGIDSNRWCSVCQPEAAPWCNTSSAAIQDGNEDTSGGSGLSPAVAGVIGAVVTLAVTGLLGLALFFICGFRLRRADKSGDTSVLGGFKGSERMPDDKDVAVSKGGAQHERVGSWELRDGPATPAAFSGAGIVTSDFHRRDEAMGVEDDGISVTGARVVNTRESI